MIQRVTVDGRPGSAMFVDDKFVPIEEKDASFLKIVFDDGGQLILAAGTGMVPSKARAWREAKSRALSTLSRTRAYDESEHPRDEHGRWTDSGGGDGGGKEHPGEGYTKDAYVKDGVIYTTSVNDAARALGENRKVELDQPRKVSTLITKLGKVAKDMIAKGQEAPVFNLCNVTVAGTNLFCVDNIGIPRVEMPQLDDQQTKDFRKYLEKQGYKIEKDKVRAAHLRATQNELNGAKVANIAEKLRDKPDHQGKRLIVSRDDYVLDGHHHWAATVGLDAEDNKLNTKMRVARVDISITKLLEEAEKFTGGKGKKPATETTTSKQLASKILAELVERWDESQHPREPAGSSSGGEFTSGGGGGESSGAEHSASSLYQPPTKTPADIMAKVPGSREKIAAADKAMAATVPTSAPVAQGGHKLPDGSWTPERAAVHADIINRFFTPEKVAAATPAPGEKPVLHMLGGRGGSGKSWFTGKDGSVDKGKALYANADDFIAELPDYKGWNAGLVYEEGGVIGQEIERQARERGLNVIIDATMKNEADTRNRFEQFKAAGYDIIGHYMYASPETAARRASSRFVEGGEKGRYVSLDYVLGSITNEKTFDNMRPMMKAWEVVDNNVDGRAPRVHARSKGDW